jgi:hypothetical protein
LGGAAVIKNLYTCRSTDSKKPTTGIFYVLRTIALIIAEAVNRVTPP